MLTLLGRKTVEKCYNCYLCTAHLHTVVTVGCRTHGYYFWNSEGIPLINYKDKAVSITVVSYDSILERLKEVIKEQKREKLTKANLHTSTRSNSPSSQQISTL